MSDRLRGFRTLKDGRIHLRCPTCGRKQSNMNREKYDPPQAVLAEILCPKCAEGAMEPQTYYFDANGNEVTKEPR